MRLPIYLIISIHNLRAYGGEKRFPDVPEGRRHLQGENADLQDADCTSPAITGMCEAYIPSYFFDAVTRECEKFIYGGCGGNGNRYASRAECIQVCGDADCTSAAETGMCRAYFPSYFFNTATQECEKFIFGGCGGNGNRYVSLAECKQVCGGKKEPELVTHTDRGLSDSPDCISEKLVGPCKAAIRKFFFNVATGKCERFVYGGCQGNGNRYESVAECENMCQKKHSIRGEEEASLMEEKTEVEAKAREWMGNFFTADRDDIYVINYGCGRHAIPAEHTPHYTRLVAPLPAERSVNIEIHLGWRAGKFPDRVLSADELLDRLEYVALEHIPPPIEKIDNWDIRWMTPRSTLDPKKHVTVKSVKRDGKVKLLFECEFFALHGDRSTDFPLPMDVGAPSWSYFRIDKKVKGQISLYVTGLFSGGPEIMEETFPPPPRDAPPPDSKEQQKKKAVLSRVRWMDDYAQNCEEMDDAETCEEKGCDWGKEDKACSSRPLKKRSERSPKDPGEKEIEGNMMVNVIGDASSMGDLEQKILESLRRTLTKAERIEIINFREFEFVYGEEDHPDGGAATKDDYAQLRRLENGGKSAWVQYVVTCKEDDFDELLEASSDTQGVIDNLVEQLPGCVDHEDCAVIMEVEATPMELIEDDAEFQEWERTSETCSSLVDTQCFDKGCWWSGHECYADFQTYEDEMFRVEPMPQKMQNFEDEDSGPSPVIIILICIATVFPIFLALYFFRCRRNRTGSSKGEEAFARQIDIPVGKMEGACAITAQPPNDIAYITPDAEPDVATMGRAHTSFHPPPGAVVNGVPPLQTRQQVVVMGVSPQTS